MLVRSCIGNGVKSLLGAAALGVKHLYSEELRLLSHAIRLGANGSSDVSTVTVAVGVLTVIGEVLEELGAALKILSQLVSIFLLN